MGREPVTGNAGRLAGYGKLPFSREYIKVNCRDRAAGELVDLLDRAAPFLLEALRQGGPIQALLALGRAATPLAAAIVPSHDAGGLRPFPFTLFTPLDAGPLRADPVGVVAGLGPLLAGLGRLADRAGERESYGELEALLTRARVDGSGGEAPRRGAATLGEWAASLHGGNRERFLLTLWQLGRLLGGGKEGRGRAVRGIKLPLTPALDRWEQAACWLSLIPLRRDGREAWSLMLHQAGKEGRLTLFLQGPAPQDLQVLAPGASVPGFHDYTVDREPTSLAGFSAFSDRVERHLSRGLTMDRLAEVMEECNP